LPPALSAGFVAVKSVIAGELESFFRDKCGQGGEGVQGGDPFRGGRVQVGTLRNGRIVGDDAGVAVVMEAGERKGGVNQIGSEPFPCGAVGGGNAFPLLDDEPHRLRRGALHLPARRSRQNVNLFLREP